MTAACQASPVADAERLYFGTGLRPSGAGPLVAVKAGAAGDVTLKEGEEGNAGVAWVRARSGPALASPLLYQGYLYVLEQRGGFLSCYEARTGQPAYGKRRLPGGRGFTSSPWAYEGKVFCLADDGKTFVVQAGPEYKLLGTNALNGETCWATPAVAGGALILRSVDYLYCLKK
jgi:outer membrane protein assembly factor BamB